MTFAARIGFAGWLLTFGSFALAQQDVAEVQQPFEFQCKHYLATTSCVIYKGFDDDPAEYFEEQHAV